MDDSSGRKSTRNPASRKTGKHSTRNTTRSSRFRSSKLSSSSSRARGGQSGAGGWHSEKPRVLNAAGADVTPMSLVPVKGRGGRATGGDSAATGTLGDATLSGSHAGGGSSGRGGGGGETKSAAAPSGSSQERKRETKAEEDRAAAAAAEAAAAPVELDPDEDVLVVLNETNTMTLLNIRGHCVWTEDKEYKKITKSNEDYTRLVNARDGSDNLSTRHAQTFNDAQKHKEVMVAPAATRDVGCR